jgi:hypothetical protein
MRSHVGKQGNERRRSPPGPGEGCYTWWFMSSAVADSIPRAGDVFIPHEAEAGPVTAVRNNVLQASLTLLRAGGFYERYAELVEPAILREVSANVAPCWVPIEVVDEHYRACDAMQLSTEVLEGLGEKAGQHARKTSIIVAQPEQDGGFELWENARRMHRVWKRHYRGGSVQIVRLGTAEELIDFRGFSLHRHRYYRYGSLAAIRAAHESLGMRIEVARIAQYDASSHALTVHLAWR